MHVLREVQLRLEPCLSKLRRRAGAETAPEKGIPGRCVKPPLGIKEGRSQGRPGGLETATPWRRCWIR